jgi:hypothetical protein
MNPPGSKGSVGREPVALEVETVVGRLGTREEERTEG